MEMSPEAPCKLAASAACTLMPSPLFSVHPGSIQVQVLSWGLTLYPLSQEATGDFIRALFAFPVGFGLQNGLSLGAQCWVTKEGLCVNDLALLMNWSLVRS